MNILVVDDEPDVQPLFEQRFRREIRSGKLTFAFASSGQMALDYLNQHAFGVVLVLSDINMPGMDGLELLRRIRDEHPMKPPSVMMVTAYGDDRNHQAAIRFGADDFLTKPVDFEILKSRLANLTQE
ncbi:response regulator [Spirosoma taeanense]|uniref:Response regulator n=1 Tax=Spirosoma taeanense TaxID=2735870 RepID=A0A6M5Y177_9BACT|nr:response regulator [Spirosoma taeanense]QJW88487.1 response regulator [Spirosoma taeanense]